MKKLRLELLCFLILVFSCDSKLERTEESMEFELEVVDSIQIPVLEYLTLLDVHSTKELFLFNLDGENSPIILTDAQGQEISRLQVPNDAPTGFGGYCSAGIFVGDTVVI